MSKKLNLFATFRKEEAQQKKEQLKENSNKSVRMKMGTTKRLIISFLISAMFFCLCIIMIKSMVKEEEKVTVVVATEAIPENLKITDINRKYFTIKEIPVSILPEGVLKDIEQVNGYFTVCKISKNQILTTNFFADKMDSITMSEKTVEVSVGTGSISQIVGGTIREGDIVNISSVTGDYATDENGDNTYVYTAVTIAEGAYVTKTFTSAGTSVESHDAEQSVTVINLLLPAEDENEFNAALEAGTLRISRICD